MTNQIILTDEEVVRSYSDADFRETLTQEQLFYASQHPSRPDDYFNEASNLELSDDELEAVAGGAEKCYMWSAITVSSGSCCSGCEAPAPTQ
jgi:hypothetical protein